jgi:soluble lytic murein transglycosylase-like protein
VRADAAGPVAGLQRAQALFDIGLPTDSGWEVDGDSRAGAEKDVAHLSAVVADWLSSATCRAHAARGQAQAGPGWTAALPRAVQKQVYPDGYSDLVVEQTARFGVDPLLMLAMMRQESSFEPKAQCGAQAMGLTQIVPSTARSIAARLDYPDFTVRDLFKPSLSLEFGTWYLSTLLKEFDNRPFPALAAYNAGGGNVARWLDRYGDDPDVLIELVPFAETQTYLRIVYDNYWHYRALYGAIPVR